MTGPTLFILPRIEARSLKNQKQGLSRRLNYEYFVYVGEYSCNVSTGSGSLVGYIHVFVAGFPRVSTDIKSFDDNNATEKVSVKVIFFIKGNRAGFFHFMIELLAEFRDSGVHYLK